MYLYPPQLERCRRECDELGRELRQREGDMATLRQEHSLETERGRLRMQQQLTELEPLPERLKVQQQQQQYKPLAL